ncbi:serine threonine- kinase Sgk1 isoform X1 [Labeo rohita]|uniref:Serine threonine-kinase Sgk1 isoform X1 n=1 Tax=Labeo rohita TaxID=84645 RepID=A0A498MGC2_LABRO|nr:serine threonine- kinase Sgk1 isoform X1 [Labeo rohita]
MDTTKAQKVKPGISRIKPCKSMQPEAETPDGIEEVKTTGSSLMLQEICITLGSAECAGRPEAMRLVHNAEKQSFSFKKCSAFQFVKRKVRRWMRNPKVNVEKVQAKGFLSPCPKCQEGQDLWYTHFPAPYGCCHYSPGGYYLPHPPSPLCQPCAPCTPCQPDKNKTCKE